MATRRRRISGKQIGTMVVVAVVAVVGYDWYKHNTNGPVAGARPGTVQA